MNQTDFDVEAAHKYFSAQCFNQAWDLIDKEDRTPDEDVRMLQLSMASHWHWTQRPDYSEKSGSIGYWQISRVYAMLEQGQNARRFGQLCLKVSQEGDLDPFYLGYAYEALARAETVVGDPEKAGEYLAKAREIAATISDEETRQPLLDDLDTIQ